MKSRYSTWTVCKGTAELAKDENCKMWDSRSLITGCRLVFKNEWKNWRWQDFCSPLMGIGGNVCGFFVNLQHFSEVLITTGLPADTSVYSSCIHIKDVCQTSSNVAYWKSLFFLPLKLLTVLFCGNIARLFMENFFPVKCIHKVQKWHLLAVW